MTPPRPPTPDDRDRRLFEVLTRRILAGGLTWSHVDARWPATRDALGDCDPGVVASLDDDALVELARHPDVLRGQEKLRTVVANAQAFVELGAQHGSVQGWLESLREAPWQERVRVISGALRGVRERRAWRFLREVGEPVPEAPPWLEDS